MNPTACATSRKSVYAILITIAVAAAAGRIVSAELVVEPSLPRPWPASRPRPTPTFGSNDRSRWATIRNLVHDGTFIIGRRDVVSSPIQVLAARDPLQEAIFLAVGKQYRIDEDTTVTDFRLEKGTIFRDGYFSVDKVLDPDTLEFYSSKPPLLTTILAGEYWLLYQLGLSIDDHPWLVVRIVLFTVNWLPLLIYLILLSRLVDRFGTTDWGRYFVVAAGCFATLVTAFAVVLNNHMPATFCAMFAFYAALGIFVSSKEGQAKPAGSLFLVAGLFAGLAACCELPAMALTAALFLLLLVKEPRRTLLLFVPAAALPLAAYLATNYLEIGSVVPVQAQFGSDWYDYEGSNWKPGPDKTGIDYAWTKETRAAYAFHVLLGHHGLFSLSPIYLLAAVGMIWGAFGIARGRDGATSRPDEPARDRLAAPPAGVPRIVFPLAIYLSVVVIGFYLIKTDNYGGWTTGLRWLMWLTPFWLLAMLPVADRLACCRRGRALGYVLLAISVLSVSYRSWNPWRHPWLYNLMEALGWPGYGY